MMRRFFPVLLLLLVASPVGKVFAESTAGTEQQQKPGTVTGQILAKGGVPLSWGEVLFYDAAVGPPPRPDLYDRAPDVFQILDAEGRFTVSLPTGTYYLGAFKRMSQEQFGPPREGDYLLKTVDAKGNVLKIEVKAGVVLSTGKLPEAVKAEAKDLAKGKMTTGIEGTVTDTEGNLLSNAVVLAYTHHAIQGKPVFISEPTGPDGVYHLRLTAGTYYLRVRNVHASGPPQPGEIVGFYGDGTPAPVEVKAAEIVSGIDFTAVLFGGRGPRAGAQPF